MSDLAQISMSEHDARKLTERIRIAAVNYSEAKDKLLRLVHDAKEGSAHVALGYASWTAYLADVMSEEPLRLARDDRREVVQLLTEEGMSTRAIAPVVDTPRETVRRWASESTDPNGSVEPRKVDSLDGKTRTQQPQQEAPRPKRRPLGEQVHDAAWEARRSAERVIRLIDDDRYPQHKEEVATLLRSHLQYAVETYTGILDHLDS